MKYNFIKSTFILTLLAVLVSCTEEFDEINTDPNNPTDIPAEYLLTNAQFSLADRVWGRGLNFEFGMLMVQHFSQSEYAEDSRYNQNPSTFSGAWNSFYAAGMKDLLEAQELTLVDENLSEPVRANRVATIEIMKVWAMQIVTDLWVNIPYEEAFNAEFPNPRYSSQEVVYNGLIADLNDAIASIDAGAAGFAAGDIFYDGDMAAWSRFANSLKLRIALRIADVDAGRAATLATEAVNAGVMTANDESFILDYQADQRIANPFYVDSEVNNRDDFCVSDVLVQALNDKNDPRVDAFAKPNLEGDIVGLPYGLPDGETFILQTNSSRPTDDIRQATAPAYLLSYAEVAFGVAEAIERGFVAGDATAEYANGVTASMNQWGITDATAIADYLVANPYNSANWKQLIGEQKWLALYTNGLEAWSEWRRLDFPVLAVPAAAVINSIPTRAFYPAVELGNNPTAVKEAGISNDMTVKPWWDVN